MRRIRSYHDCANDGTCGQYIRSFEVGDSDILYHGSNGWLIAQIPRLPNGTPSQYYNNLYKPTNSKKFDKNPKHIDDVLPNKFNFEYEHIRYIVNYDNISQREQEQIKSDIKNAYNAYKEKFCINRLGDNLAVQIYIFNNQNDLSKHIELAGFSNEYGKVLGITNGEKVLCYKASDMDNTLAHELGHVFQFRLSTKKVKEVDNMDAQLIANAIGQEVEEKNHKTILEQKGVEEYREFTGGIDFRYKGVKYCVRHKNLFEEEKNQTVRDIKDSHEFLIIEYHKLWKIPPIKNAIVVILIAEDKNVESIFYQNPWNTFTPLNKALISRGKPENKEENNQNQVENESKNVQSDNDKKETESITLQETQYSSANQISDTSSFVDVIIKPFSAVLSFFSGFISWLFRYNEEKTDESTQPTYNDLSLLNSSKAVEESQPDYTDNHLSYDCQRSYDDLI